jgi:hypothetical protein
VVSDGPKIFYKIISDINELSDEDEFVVSLNDIGVTGVDNRVVNLIGLVVKTDDNIASVRFSRNSINGNFIEDAYIYRSNL